MGRRAPTMLLVISGVLAVAIAACGGATAPPTSGPRPSPPPATATATGTATPPPLAGEVAEVQAALLSNVDTLIAEAGYLADATCEDLKEIARANPNLVESIRGFAATLKRIGTAQSGPETETLKVALANLDRVMGQFEGALSLCGIIQR